MVFICYQQDNAQNPSSWALTIRKKEFPDVQVGFRKDRNHKSNCQHPLDHRKSKELQKTSAALTALKPLYGSQIGKFLEMGIPDRLTCLLRNLYAGQETTVRTGHRTTFQIGKGVHQGCMLLPALFNLCTEYIMQNLGLDEAQAGIKISGRNINNLRYADDTSLMAESKEELKSFLMKVKEKSEKAGLKLNIQKTNIMVSSPCHCKSKVFMANRWGNNGNSDRLYFLGLQNHCGW